MRGQTMADGRDGIKLEMNRDQTVERFPKLVLRTLWLGDARVGKRQRFYGNGNEK